MLKKILCLSLLLTGPIGVVRAGDYLQMSYGEQLVGSTETVGLWWASSGWKISPDKPLPETKGRAVMISAARNEVEAVQLVVRPTFSLKNLTFRTLTFDGPGDIVIPKKNIQILKVQYVNVTRPTDKSSTPGLWPDPLPPLKGSINLEANKNQPFWIRVKIPHNAPAGTYMGYIALSGENYDGTITVHVKVYDFVLPDQMTCTTAFGFSPGNVFRYQKLSDDEHKRQVLDKYWANLSAHHISPYDPAPLDRIDVAWPDVKRTERTAPAEKLKVTFDFSAWDRAMARAIDHHNFNSFRLRIPGLGGGTFHAISEPELRGFKEDEPEYSTLLESYCRQMQDHLAQKGWLDEAFVYWFDEPKPDQYAFVMNGFEKLKRYCPKIDRMLTEQPEPQLEGGPNIYCVISNLYRPDAAQKRRAFGDKFWWYICTGPKTPYCTLFIDHPGTELRIWLWQTWQRNIEGILVWQTNYWTSSAAYPDHPQNPYEDPMGWRSGYSTPKGEKRPWGNGDGRFIYPPVAAANADPSGPVLDGPVDSIRWEMLRDGIEDYEYLVILKNLLEARKSKLTHSQQQDYAGLLEVPDAITSDMTTFTKDPSPIEKRRDQIARAIEKLNKL